MKLKLNLLIGLFILSTTGLKAQTTTPAFTASHLKAAEQYLIATGISAQFGEVISKMVNSSSAQIPEEHRASYLKVMEVFMGKYYTWDVLKDSFTKIYAAEFTEDELKQLTAFYNTPLGKKVGSKTPVLMQKGIEIGQQTITAHRPELEQMMKEAFQNDDPPAVKEKGN
ncbi:MAG: hypothetical protein JWR38_166 [Mucilaginibacter sp.]|nr:hypothetical protein [Mucilaginibacter sp.]